MGTLIDSSVFITIERTGIPVDTLIPAHEETAISAVTVSELLQGVHRSAAPVRDRREAYINRILDTFTVIAFDEPVARTHARLTYELHKAGTPLGAHDVMIGATALHVGYEVLTLDARSFPRMPGLRCRLFSR